MHWKTIKQMEMPRRKVFPKDVLIKMGGWGVRGWYVLF